MEYKIRKGTQEEYHEAIRDYHSKRTTYRGQRKIDFAKEGKLEIKLRFGIDELTFQKNIVQYIKTLSDYN